MNKTPWLNTTLYPFQSRTLDIEGNSLHYIDEGTGPVIVFAHGTPEWSFGYRELIKLLRGDFRCIAIDMLGFGLSNKKVDSDYTCKAHARRFELAIEKLALKKITIIANDFGGAIAMNYAISHPTNIRAIVLFNTWMWSLKNDSHYSGPAKVMNSWFGKWMYLSLNFPVNVVMPQAYGNKKLLTREIHAHYKNALPKGSRTAAYTFAKELMAASDWWQSLWERADILKGKPLLFFWGLKDKFVPASELEKWRQKFSDAKAITFADAGHFVQEEKPTEMANAIREFLKSN